MKEENLKKKEWREIMGKAEVLVKYVCSACGKDFDDEQLATNHVDVLLIEERLPIGFVFRYYRDENIVILPQFQGRAGKIDRRDHGVWQDCDGYTRGTISATRVKRGLKKGDFKLLNEREFVEFNSKYKPPYNHSFPLIRSTPELEELVRNDI